MAATTAHRRGVNHKFTGEIQIVARPAFDLTSDSAAMRVPGTENLFCAPPGSAAIRANQKLRS